MGLHELRGGLGCSRRIALPRPAGGDGVKTIGSVDVTSKSRVRRKRVSTTAPTKPAARPKARAAFLRGEPC